jgi:hypothetical protein
MMSEPRTGLGLNAEPDDFAVRYQRMVDIGVAPLLTRVALVVAGSLVILWLFLALIGG